MPQDIFAYIKQEEANYAKEIEVMDNWNWCMKDHVRTSIMMKHGKFLLATNELTKKNPYRNIIYPVLNLRYRAENIDMRDVVVYADDPDRHHLSFLIKKYHDEVYIREHDLDTFFDETQVESVDIGGTLVRKGKDGPIYEPLESIAFCDQTDILSGPIGFKEFFAPDELYAMKSAGWGETKNGADITLDELITLADESKQQDSQKGMKTTTPGKYIEVYRVHGVLPKSYLDDSDETDDERYVRQIHIVAFYSNSDGDRKGVTLYKNKEPENPFKIYLSGKKIRNRALAYGGVEELIDPQVWTNYSEIRKKMVIEAVSKVVRWTTDESFDGRNKLNDVDNNEMLVLRDGAQIGVLPTDASSVGLFNEWLNEWFVLTQRTSGATDALMGESPSAGTPFKLEATVVQQGQGLHDYRKGRFATFIEEIYKDWIIPDLIRKVTGGATFLATLSQDEMEYVTDCVVRSLINKTNDERVLSGHLPFTEEEKAMEEQKIREEFGRRGNKHFLEILKDEFKDVPLAVKVNVAGKQKDLVGIVDKITNVFRQVLSNPAILQDPKAAKVFNKLIEYSGLDPIDFGYATQKPQQPMQQPMQPQQALPSPQPAMQ